MLRMSTGMVLFDWLNLPFQSVLFSLVLLIDSVILITHLSVLVINVCVVSLAREIRKYRILSRYTRFCLCEGHHIAQNVKFRLIGDSYIVVQDQYIKIDHTFNGLLSRGSS